MHSCLALLFQLEFIQLLIPVLYHLVFSLYISGEIGCAAKMKLVLNLFMGTVIAGLAESLALAEKVGLDQEGVLQILDLSPVACPLVKTKGHGESTIFTGLLKKIGLYGKIQ